MNIDETPGGYPGFRVASPPELRLVGATLSRVAFAKLSGITMFSASFKGERFSFSPWLTVLIEYAHRKLFVGIYSTGEGEPEGTPAEVASVPTFCLRWSEWDRDKDTRRVSDMASLQDYLKSGPHIENTFTFGNRATHPEMDQVMDAVLAVLTAGISVAPTAQRVTEWHHVTVDLADDRFACDVSYSPLLAHSEALETALPPWLDAVDRLVRQTGLKPDDEITISIARSVPEIVNADPFAKHLGHTELRY
jgi:hypothetical protein